MLLRPKPLATVMLNLLVSLGSGTPGPRIWYMVSRSASNCEYLVSAMQPKFGRGKIPPHVISRVSLVPPHTGSTLDASPRVSARVRVLEHVPVGTRAGWLVRAPAGVCAGVSGAGGCSPPPDLDDAAVAVLDVEGVHVKL